MSGDCYPAYGAVTCVAVNSRRRCSPDVVGSYFGASPGFRQVGNTLDGCASKLGCGTYAGYRGQPPQRVDHAMQGRHPGIIGPACHQVAKVEVPFYEISYIVPVTVDWPGTLIAINVGGAVIPRSWSRFTCC